MGLLLLKTERNDKVYSFVSNSLNSNEIAIIQYNEEVIFLYFPFLL